MSYCCDKIIGLKSVTWQKWPPPECYSVLSVAGMAALNGSLGSGGLSNGSGNTMEALSQAYSGIQQYAAAALPSLYNQSLLSQQSVSAAGSQKEGGLCGLSV